jgi:hypothetical protein
MHDSSKLQIQKLNTVLSRLLLDYKMELEKPGINNVNISSVSLPKFVYVTKLTVPL